MFNPWPPTDRIATSLSVARYLNTVSDLETTAMPLSEEERHRLYQLLDLGELVVRSSPNHKLFPNFQPRSR